jgi:hypothetical protein
MKSILVTLVTTGCATLGGVSSQPDPKASLRIPALAAHIASYERGSASLDDLDTTWWLLNPRMNYQLLATPDDRSPFDVTQERAKHDDELCALSGRAYKLIAARLAGMDRVVFALEARSRFSDLECEPAADVAALLDTARAGAELAPDANWPTRANSAKVQVATVPVIQIMSEPRLGDVLVAYGGSDSRRDFSVPTTYAIEDYGGKPWLVKHGGPMKLYKSRPDKLVVLGSADRARRVYPDDNHPDGAVYFVPHGTVNIVWDSAAKLGGVISPHRATVLRGEVIATLTSTYGFLPRWIDRTKYLERFGSKE